MAQSLFIGSYVALWILALLTALCVAVTLRYLGFVQRQLQPMFRHKGIDRLKPGIGLPPIPLWNGRTGQFFDPAAMSDYLMLVVRADCDPCTAVTDRVTAYVAAHGGRPEREVVLVVGSMDEYRRLEGKGLLDVPIVFNPSNHVRDVWAVSRVPLAIQVGAEAAITRVWDPVAPDDIDTLFPMPTLADIG
jgi:hypothetical protein